MDVFAHYLTLIDAYIGGSQWFVYLLLGTGIFFTLYLRFPQIRYFRYSFRVVAGRYDRVNDFGDTSHFQALSTALSGTVGTGNIAGVALAIHLGGPAALFWMLVTAFLGMTTKFVEVTLSHKYREKSPDGKVAGGPMYYMRNKMKMPWLAAIFAIATIFSSFGTGSMPQINSIASAMFTTFHIDHIYTGIGLALVLALIIIGGIRRIAKVTSVLVPFMAIFYFIGALAVLIYNANQLWPALISVFTDVFTGTAATGGFLGAGFAYAFNRGVNRGLFSNEAGQGSAPIAHAAARAHEPVSEGIVALLEPFIDTIVICFLTGMVILSSGVWKEKTENHFQATDTRILSGVFADGDASDRQKLYEDISGKTRLPEFSGELKVVDGNIISEVTIIHSRSVAENVMVRHSGNPYTGKLLVHNGRIADQEGKITLIGNSLLHSAPLTTAAFERSYLSHYGRYIVAIGLLLFAFSTAISWSYYGEQAVIYLAGIRFVMTYRILYVLGFFLAAITDTTIVWIFSGITVALMALPNLIGILYLHKDVKGSIADYWRLMRKEHPNDSFPD